MLSKSYSLLDYVDRTNGEKAVSKPATDLGARGQ